MADATNVRIGACQVWYKGVDIGHTQGGVTFSYSPDYTELKVDKWASAVDMALSGEEVTVTIRLAEPQAARLRYAIAAGNYEPTGSPTHEFGRSTGFLGSSFAGTLRLHPLALANSNQAEDIHIYKAVAVDDVELEYTVDDQLVVEVTLRALVDETKTDGSVLGHIGTGVS